MAIKKFTTSPEEPCRRIKSRAGVESFVDFERNRIGLLRRFDDEGYGFSIDLFREYLAACDIIYRGNGDNKECEDDKKSGIDAKMTRVWKDVKDYIGDPNWQEVLAFALALSAQYSDGFEILTKIFLSEEGEKNLSRDFVFRLNLVIQSIRLKKKIPIGVRDRIFTRIFIILGSDQRDNLIKPFEVLSWFGKNEDGIKRNLNDIVRGQRPQILHKTKIIEENKSQAYTSYVRFQAARTLPKIGFLEDGIDCLHYLVDDTEVEEEIQYEIAKELFTLGESKKANKIMLSIVQFGKDTSTRIDASETLLEHGILEGLRFLGLDTELDSLERLSIAEELMCHKESRAASRIFVELCGDSFIETSTRSEAANLLMEQGNLEGWKLLGTDTKVDDEYRYAAAKILYSYDVSDKSKSVAWSICQNATSNAYKIKAARLLMKMNDSRGCLKVVQDEGLEVQEQCEIAEDLFERNIIEPARVILLKHSLDTSTKDEDEREENQKTAAKILLKYSERWIFNKKGQVGFDTLIKLLLARETSREVQHKAYNLLRSMKRDHLLMNLGEFISLATPGSSERNLAVKFRKQIRQERRVDE